MNNENKLELKIVALQEVHYKRLQTLDDEIANLRVALTEQNQTLQEVQREFEEYKIAHPEETDVPQAPEDDTQN